MAAAALVAVSPAAGRVAVMSPAAAVSEKKAVLAVESGISEAGGEGVPRWRTRGRGQGQRWWRVWGAR